MALPSTGSTTVALAGEVARICQYAPRLHVPSHLTVFFRRWSAGSAALLSPPGAHQGKMHLERCIRVVGLGPAGKRLVVAVDDDLVSSFEVPLRNHCVDVLRFQVNA